MENMIRVQKCLADKDYQYLICRNMVVLDSVPICLYHCGTKTRKSTQLAVREIVPIERQAIHDEVCQRKMSLSVVVN